MTSTTNYQVALFDISNSFAPYVSGTKAATTGYNVNGNDLCNLFKANTSGFKRLPTGFKAINGSDLSDIFDIYYAPLFITASDSNAFTASEDYGGIGYLDSTFYGTYPVTLYCYSIYYYYDIDLMTAPRLQYAKRTLTSLNGSFKGHTIQFDIYGDAVLYSSAGPTIGLVNIFFGCDTNGNGQAWRLDTRSLARSGFAQTTGWNNAITPSTTNNISNLSPNTWYRVIIKISSQSPYTMSYTVNNGTVYNSSFNYNEQGNYVAIHSDYISSTESGGGAIANFIVIN